MAMGGVVTLVCASLSIIFILNFGVTSAEDITISLSNCEGSCRSSYGLKQNPDEEEYCVRGCRLMRLIDFANGAFMTENEMSVSCNQSCDTAYDGSGNSAAKACRAGCYYQLSGAELRRLQLDMFYREQIHQMLMINWFNRLMNCRLFSFSDDPDNDDGVSSVSARVIIISSGRQSGSIQLDATRQMLRAPSAAMSESRNVETTRQDPAYAALYDISVHAMFILGLLLILVFGYLLCYPVHEMTVLPPQQKLSIYGDGENLKLLDEDDALIDIKPRAQMFTEQPTILMKIPVKSI